MNSFKLPALAASLFLGLGGLAPAWAQTPPAKPLTEQERFNAQSEAWKAAEAFAKAGPVKVTLNDQGSITLKEGVIFVPLPQAADLMRAMGNTVSRNFLGILTSTNQSEAWIATISFVKEGYVKDDDAKNWNADELLSSLKEGTEASNKFRRERGFPALAVKGWIEPPAYTATKHQLVWSLSAAVEGVAPDAPQSVNYNTYQLGRAGYFSLNMVTTSVGISAHKAIAHTLLAGLEFDTGKRYEDFNAATDNVAAYGLAALVGGVALKKAGFFAIILALMLKFWKVGLLALFGIGYALKKLFFKKKDA